MNLREILYQSRIPRDFYAMYLLMFLAGTKIFPLGTNIYQEDWDLLVVLDACRFDAILQIQDEYNFIDNPNSIQSVGSTSKEWMVNTFIDKHRQEISNTSYICANSWSDRIFRMGVDWTEWSSTNDTWLDDTKWAPPIIKRNTVNADEFYQLECLSYLGDEHPHRPIPFASPITDRAINMGRNNNSDRMIIHYMQPHAPYYGRIDESTETKLLEHESRPFRAMRSGTSKEIVWESYLNNLRYVLDEVSRLRDNINADRMIITSDHGDLFGELGFYGHPAGHIHPDVRRVPWIKTTAQDKKTSIPSNPPESDEPTEQETFERLKDLGYL